MQQLQKFAADYMVAHPGSYTITGLMHHYACEQNPDLGTNYLFWENFCEWLIDKSDRVIVLKFPDWEFSTGVLDEVEYAKAKGIPVEYQSI